MPFEWHDHHFINRIACLDFSNTVVNRNRPERTEDRLKSECDVESWLVAAGLGNEEEIQLAVALELREAVDTLFRTLVATGGCASATWDKFLTCCTPHLRGRAFGISPSGLSPAMQLDGLFAVAYSALTLAMSPQIERLRVCGGCGWLFIDRTRNGTKKWCISAMCGSRDKARRYYARKALSASL